MDSATKAATTERYTRILEDRIRVLKAKLIFERKLVAKLVAALHEAKASIDGIIRQKKAQIMDDKDQAWWLNVDIENLLLPQPPGWWLAERTAPVELNIGEETEKAVRRYCYAVAMDDSSHARALLHRAVCERLGMCHGDFAPFEDERIARIPTPSEAVGIFWKALESYRAAMTGEG